LVATTDPKNYMALIGTFGISLMLLFRFQGYTLSIIVGCCILKTWLLF